MTVGERLKAARKRRNKTQQQIADELGCKQPTIADWESGRVLPKTREIRAVARAYGITPMQLLPDEQVA